MYKVIHHFTDSFGEDQHFYVYHSESLDEALLFVAEQAESYTHYMDWTETWTDDMMSVALSSIDTETDTWYLDSYQIVEYSPMVNMDFTSVELAIANALTED